MSRVTLNPKHARALRDYLQERDDLSILEHAALGVIQCALAPSTKRTRARAAKRAQKTDKRQTKAEETADISVRVAMRAGTHCECGCGRRFQRGHPVLNPEMDHGEGRGKARQRVSNCWLLAAVCHRARHAGRPSRGYWLREWAEHCERHGYITEAQQARAKLASLADVAAAAEVMGVRT